MAKISRIPADPQQGPRYRGLAAIRYLSPALFEQFGLGKWLRHERTRAHLRAQRRRDAARKRERKHGAAAGAGQLLEQLTTKLAAARARAKSRDALASVDHHAEFERAVMIRAGQLKEANPDWDRDQCFRVARSQLSPPG
ncbi:hypothetical protein [Burkholderia glumae]|uniref:hypothetical protein n=1 Tax=Burkholderia glumae TaxID=337 RepID=UPI0002F8C6CF|nr:hypothetical protein [Burkholderia glumae]